MLTSVSVVVLRNAKLDPDLQMVKGRLAYYIKFFNNTVVSVGVPRISDNR